MHDDQPKGDPSHKGEVGSVAEEAAKLFAALGDFAREHRGDTMNSATAAASAASDALRNVNAHIATDAVECRYCPVCQVVHAVRATSPEVRAHLAAAAASLAQAAAGMLATTVPKPTETPVQKIDLDEDGWDGP